MWLGKTSIHTSSDYKSESSALSHCTLPINESAVSVVLATASANCLRNSSTGLVARLPHVDERDSLLFIA